MQAKRFIAADMRRALDMVKEEYGEDAMIISTERTARGVELVATGEGAMEQLQKNDTLESTVMTERQQKIASAASGFQSIPDNAELTFAQQYQSSQAQSSLTKPSPSNADERGPASGKTKQQLADEMELANRRMQAAKEAESMTLETWADKEYALQQARKNQSRIKSQPVIQESMEVEPNVQASNTYASNAQENRASVNRDSEKISSEKIVSQNMASQDREIRRLHDEITDMRETIEVQLLHMSDMQERQYHDTHMHNQPEDIFVNATAGSIPIQNTVKRMKKQLEFLSLPKAANDKIISDLQKKGAPDSNKALLWRHVLTQVSRHIPSDTSDPVAQGGTYAFLGTTGVGKTTTIAKLAARYVMENGPDGVVLLTTDNHRIAAHNQLTALAKVLNVRVEVVDDLQQLPRYLEQLQDYSLTLIDTPGMGYADPLLKPHLHVLQQCAAVQNVVVVSANNQYQMMKASLHSYGLANLDYGVMTKLDECATLSDAMGILIEHTIPLAYITDGQSVPEDIAILKSSEFISRAVNLLKYQRKNEAIESSHTRSF
jgi:flagellar biosynthesis protein FlhF